MNNTQEHKLGIKYTTKEYAEKNGLGKLKVLIQIIFDGNDYDVSTWVDDTGELCVGGDMWALCYDTKEELYLVDKALNTDEMKDLLKSWAPSGITTGDWRKIFSGFKLDFYKIFI